MLAICPGFLLQPQNFPIHWEDYTALKRKLNRQKKNKKQNFLFLLKKVHRIETLTKQVSGTNYLLDAVFDLYTERNTYQTLLEVVQLFMWINSLDFMRKVIVASALASVFSHIPFCALYSEQGSMTVFHKSIFRH